MNEMESLWKEFGDLTREFEISLGFADIIERIKTHSNKLQTEKLQLIKTLEDINEIVNKYGANPNLEPSSCLSDIADILLAYVSDREIATTQEEEQ